MLYYLKTSAGAGEMVQQLQEYITALRENLSLVPSIHVRGLTTPASEESDNAGNCGLICPGIYSSEHQGTLPEKWCDGRTDTRFFSNLHIFHGSHAWTYTNKYPYPLTYTAYTYLHTHTPTPTQPPHNPSPHTHTTWIQT